MAGLEDLDCTPVEAAELEGAIELEDDEEFGGEDEEEVERKVEEVLLDEKNTAVCNGVD